MIILKHLTVERFRLLREVNLHFPQRGSILIQGPNDLVSLRSSKVSILLSMVKCSLLAGGRARLMI